MTIEERSAYKSIIHWNKIMERRYWNAGQSIEYEKDWNEDNHDERAESNKWVRDLPAGRFVIDAGKSSAE